MSDSDGYKTLATIVMCAAGALQQCSCGSELEQHKVARILHLPHAACIQAYTHNGRHTQYAGEQDCACAHPLTSAVSSGSCDFAARPSDLQAWKIHINPWSNPRSTPASMDLNMLLCADAVKFRSRLPCLGLDGRFGIDGSAAGDTQTTWHQHGACCAPCAHMQDKHTPVPIGFNLLLWLLHMQHARTALETCRMRSTQMNSNKQTLLGVLD